MHVPCILKCGSDLERNEWGLASSGLSTGVTQPQSLETPLDIQVLQAPEPEEPLEGSSTSHSLLAPEPDLQAPAVLNTMTPHPALQGGLPDNCKQNSEGV